MTLNFAMYALLSDRSDRWHRSRRSRVRVAGFHLGRLGGGAERIRFLQLRFDRGAPGRGSRGQQRAQLVPLLFAVPTPMDFRGVQTSTHDDPASKKNVGPSPTHGAGVVIKADA